MTLPTEQSEALSQKFVGCYFFIFKSFVLFLLVMLLPFAVLALWNPVATYFWVETPASIISSRISENKVIEISFEYEYNGERFTSRQFEATRIQYATYKDAKNELDKYTTAASQVCYVNPSNPQEAIMRRGSLTFGLLLLVPISISLVVFFFSETFTKASKPRPKCA